VHPAALGGSVGKNPFGHSSQNVGSVYKGLVKDTFATFKHLRKTPTRITGRRRAQQRGGAAPHGA
jgi:hypothetical protein